VSPSSWRSGACPVLNIFELRVPLPTLALALGTDIPAGTLNSILKSAGLKK
jgi:hypothetical protein